MLRRDHDPSQKIDGGPPHATFLAMKHVGSAARRRFCVLVTAFGGFPGARVNPTVAMLAHLDRSERRLARLGIDLRCAVVPVIYADLAGVLSAAVANTSPDAILHLGLAGRRKVLSVESRAVNRAGPLHPDAAGRTPSHQSLVVGGPATMATTYPAAQILAAIRRDGRAARLSIDAGDYVCNATLYVSLLAAIAPQIGFLHVPRPRQTQPTARRSGDAKPSVEVLAKAALTAIIVMARRRHASPPATADAPTAPRRDGGPADR